MPVNDRRYSFQNRELYETVINRSGFLEKKDQLILEQVLDKGVWPREVACLTGQTTRTVQRHIQRLVKRLTDPAVETLLHEYRHWPKSRAQIAISIWLKKWTLRQTAKSLELTLHQVRQEVIKIRALLEAAGMKPKTSCWSQRRQRR